MPKNGELPSIVGSWLASYRNEKTGIAARNVVAAGIVVLDKLLQIPSLTPEDAFTPRGELKGARSGLPVVLQRHNIPRLYLKEATGRQTATYARTLLERLDYGKRVTGSPDERRRILEKGMEVLRTEALAWLRRGPLKITCDRQCAPTTWISAILKKAQGRSGGKVEQHLVGAKLQERYAERVIVPQHPGHAGDVQTGRLSDFDLGRVSYHVTSNPTRDHLRKCKENATANRAPVLVVPAEKIAKAKVYAADEGVEDRVTVLSIEDFVTQNVLEISSERDSGVFEIMKAIIKEYNRRILEIERDNSLMIEVQ